jgi:ribosomal protein L7Ae-like RNA K-turn-binding protein
MKKKLAYLLLFFLAVLQSCGNEKEQLKTENDGLKTKVRNDSVYIASLSEEMDIVYASLDSVKSLADSLLQTSDLIRNKQIGKKEGNQFINKTMSNIDSIMEGNKRQINELEARLSRSNTQKSVMKKMLDRLRKNLGEKEEIIVNLRKQINVLEQEVAGLKFEKKEIVNKLNESQTKLQQTQQQMEKIANDMTQKVNEVAALTKSNNTAYYFVGSKKDLTKKGFIKTRGLLNKVDGLGDNLPEDEMHPLDISSQNLNIDIGSSSLKDKDIVLVPARQEGLYIVSKEHGRTFLHIIHKDFWKKSKFLMVVTQ